MEHQATEFFVATRAALAQASQLAVQYSFAILGAIILLVIGWLLSQAAHRWALSAMLRIRHFDVTLARFLANLIRYALLALVMVTVLGQLGVQTASIIAALGAAGLAIGLALQGTLQNIAAGIMLLILRPFRVGESIETKDVAGTVEEIGLFVTELRTWDGLFQLVPNSLLWNTPIRNFSRLPTRRYDLNVVLPSDADIRTAEKLLLGLAARDKRVLEKPAPVVLISEASTFTVNLTMQVWIGNEHFGDASRDLSKAAKMTIEKVMSEDSQAVEGEKVASRLPPDVAAQSAPPKPEEMQKKARAESARA